ncbi:unnamed protein product [Prorocentrum cordatum]|uniref:Uncharacterized protein n=1 Tax=Prorocentrum cordatum TaxID=2364126 RepID=A0ABN9XFZ2_9DINO|nr:unnamed protein product [Polarella glacialis]
MEENVRRASMRKDTPRAISRPWPLQRKTTARERYFADSAFGQRRLQNCSGKQRIQRDREKEGQEEEEEEEEEGDPILRLGRKSPEVRGRAAGPRRPRPPARAPTHAQRRRTAAGRRARAAGRCPRAAGGCRVGCRQRFWLTPQGVQREGAGDRWDTRRGAPGLRLCTVDPHHKDAR